ncbi:hypothetical protein C8J57DRAFT_1346760 [Mycena rebaudengoi]|nr:hypothetical protein C8J57DRAFT_1346760 [Mycena rebaudengoi]
MPSEFESMRLQFAQEYWVNNLEIWVGTLLYGIYLVLFVHCIFVLLKRSRYFERQGIFFAAVTLLFCLSTAQLFVLMVKSAIVAGQSGLDVDHVLTASLLIYVTSCICADALLIYRCYAIWDDNPYVILLPAMLLIISTAFGYIRNLVIFRILSLITCVSVTVLTISRIGWAAFKWRSTMSGEMRRKYVNATSVILESGALYTLFVSIHFALFARGSSAAPILFAAVSQIVGIAPTLIFVRVGAQGKDGASTTTV